MTRFNIPTALTAISAVLLFVGCLAVCRLRSISGNDDVHGGTAGAAQVAPVDVAATGTVKVTLDTEAKTVAWVVTTEGLSGDRTASHIHGPAAATESAGPVIDTMVTMEGSTPITDDQITELTGGMY